MASSRVVDTICRMCGRYCPVRVIVEDDRVSKVEGVPGNFVTRGGVCGKGIAAVQLEYDPKRLLHPLKRVGERGSGRWETVTWDQALDEIAERLFKIRDEYGARALVYHHGAAIQHAWGYVRRFMNAWGSPNEAGHSHLCHIPRQLAHTLTYGGMPQADYDDTRLMLLWGYNPVYSSILHYAPQILDAKERGAKLIVIDPIFTAIASKADIWLQPRPGTDGALALGMLNVIISEDMHDRAFVEKWTIGFDKLREGVHEFTPERVSEITWVPASKITEVARLYATTRPAVLEEGNGIDQHTNVVQTDRALACLRAVTGNLGVPGGHLFRPGPGLADVTLKEKAPKEPSISLNPLYTGLSGQISTPHVVDALLNGRPYPVKAMIVHGSAAGAIASNADKTLKAYRRLDLLVVHEQFMTDVAEIADYVLPAATWMEQSCLVANPPAGPAPTKDTTYLGMMEKAVEPLGEARSDHDFIWALAKRLGLGEYFTTPEELYEEELSPLGLSVTKLREHPGGYIRKLRSEELYGIFEKSGFKTPSGKVELWSKTLEEHGFDPLPGYTEPAESPLSTPEVAKDYPLVCGVSVHLGLFTHTQYRTLPWLKEIYPGASVYINPATAGRLRIDDGNPVYVESPRGRIGVSARVTGEVDPRVVQVTWGWGQPYASGDRANTLTGDAERCPISGATGNRSFLCRVVKAEAS